MEEPKPVPHRLLRRAQNLEIPFGALSAISDVRKILKEWEWAAIQSARDKGAAWRDIADALGITRQALQQRLAREHGHEPPVDEA